ncbi:MAG TPA: energy transducer TonB, partial [Thermoanaerobaculia bacterium]|nr:energy transducer TonB [Thermoanaerobaculia bacterium]
AAASLPALGQTVPGATAAGAPGSKTTATAPPAAGAKVDVSGVVSQELAKREGELRKKFEDEQKRLEKELALTKNGKPSAIPPATAPAPPPSAAPAPQPTEPPAAEKRPEPPATKPEEPAAAVVPPAASRPAPAPETTEPAPQAPRVKPGDLVEPGPGVAPPELVSVTKPEYPPLARRLKVAGTVIVSVLVDEKGHVEDAKLLQGVVQKVGLNEAAVSAARTARYKPASKDGVKVKMWTRLRIPFTQ